VRRKSVRREYRQGDIKMGNVRTHRDLDIWNEGIELVTKVYSLVQGFPKEEKFGLVDQIKRASVSIPSDLPF
jgi:hypothetical protein